MQTLIELRTFVSEQLADVTTQLQKYPAVNADEHERDDISFYLGKVDTLEELLDTLSATPELMQHDKQPRVH